MLRVLTICLRNVVYCIVKFMRLFRICSNKDDFEVKAQTLYSDFKSRGYSTKWLDTALDKVCSLSDNTNLIPTKKKCVFKSTFSPLSPER